MSTTWNPADKTSDMTLSGGNLIATASAGTNAGARGTTSHATGKWQLQFTACTLGDSLDYIGVGLSTDTLGLAQGSQEQVIKVLTGTTFSGDGLGGTNALTGDAIPAGATVDLCLDFTALKFWYRVNSGDWNGPSNPTANPATGVGGRTIGAANTYFPYIRLTGAGKTATLNPSPSSPQSGFTQWDVPVTPHPKTSMTVIA